MSGITDPNVAAFHKWARENGWTHDELAYECDCNRSNISLVLSGRRPGRYTWRRMVRVLPEAGLLLLQQCSSWNKWADEALAKRREREAAAAESQRDAAGLAEIAARCRVPEEAHA
jgi:hypothetical protein